MTHINLLLLTSFLLLIQACASGEINQSSSTTSVTSKETRKLSTEDLKQEREAFYERKRNELRQQNPTLKANQAIRTKQAYLMAIPGGRAGALNIPGFTQFELDRLKCRVEKVEGVGDTIYGTNHLSYIKELRQFMLEFNTRMRPYCL